MIASSATSRCLTDQLINQVAQRTGLAPDKPRTAVDTVLGFLNAKLTRELHDLREKQIATEFYPRYAPTSYLLVVTADDKLLAIPFGPKKLEPTGAPVALIEGIGVRNGGFNIDLAPAGSCSTSTASARWCRPRLRWAPSSRSGGSARCPRWRSSPVRGRCRRSR